MELARQIIYPTKMGGFGHSHFFISRAPSRWATRTSAKKEATEIDMRITDAQMRNLHSDPEHSNIRVIACKLNLGNIAMRRPKIGPIER